MTLKTRIAHLEGKGRQNTEAVDRIIEQIIDLEAPNKVLMELVAWDRTRTPSEYPDLPRDEKGYPIFPEIASL